MVLNLFAGFDYFYDASNFNYSELYQRSLDEPENFWNEIGRSSLIHWDKPFEKVLDNSNPAFAKWFVGGYLNACYNCVDRHVLAGNGSRLAIIHDSPFTKIVQKITYQELYDTVKYIWMCFFCSNKLQV